ncbi:MAG: pilus assembly protein PilM [Chthoniobacteraceae bacterium]
MAKTFSSAIGVDLGRYSLKSVVLQKKGGNRYVLTNFASMPMDDAAERTPEMLGTQLKALVRQMGGSAKGCAVAVSSPEALVRIVEQPETPPEILREALRLNGTMLLNQDCKNFVLDCVECEQQTVPAAPANAQAAGSSAQQKRYLVAGLPRTEVAQLSQAFEMGGLGNVTAVQLAPVTVFNAFEFAQKEVFDNEAFFLIDFGHLASTMMIGAKGKLALIRSVEFGGKSLTEALCGLSGESPETVMSALAQEDEVMVEYTRMALMALTREIGSSIGFYEGHHETTISQVWVSGGLARNATLVRLLGDGLGMPCQPWFAVERCEVNVASSKRAQLAEEMLDYSVACGAAAQLLNA